MSARCRNGIAIAGGLLYIFCCNVAFLPDGFNQAESR